MTTWTWIGPETESADWGDEANWYNDTDQEANDGAPQDGDDVTIDDSAPITVGASELHTLNFTGHSQVTGNYTITGVEDHGDLVSGTMDISRGNEVDVDGATVTIDRADGIEVGSGTVKIETLGGPSTFSGGSTNAKSTGYLDSYDAVFIDMTGGHLTFSTLTLQDQSATRGIADSLFVMGGRAIVHGETSLEGGEVFAAGGRVDLQRQVTISGAMGELVVESGGAAQTGDVQASDSGGATDVNVSGKRSLLEIDGKLDLGHTGAAGLSLQSAGHIIVEGDFVAGEAGATATITIGQQEAGLTVHGEWIIGEGGAATGTIGARSHAEVDGDVILGDKQGSNGQLTVTGDQSQLDAAGSQLTIGGAGIGSLTESDGGMVAASSCAVTLGDEADASGTATVEGDGTEMTTGDLTVGGGGKGTLTIEDGAVVDVTGALALGDEQGGSGAVSVAKAELDVDGVLSVGGAGSGTLSTQRGRITVGGGLTLGEEAQGSGKMTLHAGQISVAGALTVGERGSGALMLSQGAVLAASAGHHASDLTLGEKFGVTGGVTLDGSGTSMTVKDVEDGVLGKGAITVKAGAILTANGIDIATAANSNQNSLSLATGGALSVTTDVSVGEKGYGSFSLASGAQATVSGDVTIGEDAAAIGTATVSGLAGSTSSHLAFGGTLAVGDSGSGSLTIAKGGLVSALGSGDGVVEIAAASGSIGKLTLSDAGSFLTGTALTLGGTETAAGGAGTMSIGASAQATFDEATVWASGKVTLNGALHLSGDLHGSGAVTIGAGGLLDLGGQDQGVGVDFLTTGPGGKLELSQADQLSVTVKGFAAGDSIAIDNLDKKASFSVSHSGSTTTVAFVDHGTDAGSLVLAGDFRPTDLQLTAGVLTTTKPGAKEISPHVARAADHAWADYLPSLDHNHHLSAVGTDPFVT